MRALAILAFVIGITAPGADHTKKYGEPCKETRECPTDAVCSRGKCVQGPASAPLLPNATPVLRFAPQ